MTRPVLQMSLYALVFFSVELDRIGECPRLRLPSNIETASFYGVGIEKNVMARFIEEKRTNCKLINGKLLGFPGD